MGEIWDKVIHDYKGQLAFVKGMRAVCESMNVAFEDPRREALAIQGAGRKWQSPKKLRKKMFPKIH